MSIEQAIKKCNELLASYKAAKDTLETETTKNAFDDAKEKLVRQCDDAVKTLVDHYNGLDTLNQSIFIESNEFKQISIIFDTLSNIDQKGSEYPKYCLNKIIENGCSNVFQTFSSLYNSRLPIVKENAQKFIQQYEATHPEKIITIQTAEGNQSHCDTLGLGGIDNLLTSLANIVKSDTTSRYSEPPAGTPDIDKLSALFAGANTLANSYLQSVTTIGNFVNLDINDLSDLD